SSAAHARRDALALLVAATPPSREETKASVHQPAIARSRSTRHGRRRGLSARSRQRRADAPPRAASLTDTTALTSPRASAVRAASSSASAASRGGGGGSARACAARLSASLVERIFR